jgi:hypothetical protein
MNVCPALRSVDKLLTLFSEALYEKAYFCLIKIIMECGEYIFSQSKETEKNILACRRFNFVISQKELYSRTPVLFLENTQFKAKFCQNISNPKICPQARHE